MKNEECSSDDGLALKMTLFLSIISIILVLVAVTISIYGRFLDLL